jgi:lysophospholipase L1-like esterase
MTITVACLGDSITHGLVSANYVALLEERFADLDFAWINAGVDNDTTWNMLRRVDDLVPNQPEVVLILAGTNDAIASLSMPSYRLLQVLKLLSHRPTQELAIQNMREIIQILKLGTQARIALGSIPPLGEALISRPMNWVRSYNARLRRLAEEEGIAYLQVFERMCQVLQSEPAESHVFKGSLWLSAEFVLLGEDFDVYSERKGFRLLIDGVHLNRRAAAIVADEEEKFIRSAIDDGQLTIGEHK